MPLSALSITRTCPVCSAVFEPKRRDQSFDRPTCRYAYHHGKDAVRAAAIVHRHDNPEMRFAVPQPTPERTCRCGLGLPQDWLGKRCIRCETDLRVRRALRKEAKKAAVPKERQQRLDAHAVLTPSLAVEE